MRLRHAPAMIVSILATGCVLGELDLSGKQCPCNGAYVCDETRNVCVKGNPIGDAASNADDGANTGDDAGPDDPEAGGDETGPGDVPDDDAGIADIGGVPETCNLDADCNDALYVCENNRCILRCDEEGGTMCIAPEICNPNNGRCIPGNFPIGMDCSINGQCTSGYCLNVTTSTTAGAQRFCSIPCSSTTDCPIETSCFNLGGLGFCLRETAFSPPGNFDTPPGGMCTDADNTCQSRTCNLDTSQCVQRCTRESDCAGFGDNCWTWEDGNFAGICFNAGGGPEGTACGANTQCLSGVCNRYVGTCAVHCCTEDDCAADQTCAVYDINATTPVKICRAKAMAGTRSLGDSCQTNDDCESELCAPMNSNGTGPKRCSVPCCEPTDCAVLPNGGFCWPLAGAIPNTVFGTCLPR